MHEIEEHPLRQGIGMNTYLYGPMDFTKTLKLRFRLGDLDLSERTRKRTNSREEEEVNTQICAPVGKQERV